jgi:hypothetical protein
MRRNRRPDGKSSQDESYAQRGAAAAISYGYRRAIKASRFLVLKVTCVRRLPNAWAMFCRPFRGCGVRFSRAPGLTPWASIWRPLSGLNPPRSQTPVTAHIHLPISEPKIGNPSTVMRVLKQRVSRALRRRRRKRLPGTQLCFRQPAPVARYRSLRQARFYDFNIWSRKKSLARFAHRAHIACYVKSC